MIHALLGRPRNGKSYLACSIILDTLKEPKGPCVVTNISLDLDEVEQYVGGERSVRNRIRILTDDELRAFYLYRSDGRGGCLDISQPPDSDKQSLLDFSPIFEKSIRTLYVLDEIHTIWPARGWQGTSRHLMHYLSQHAKLGDNVYWISQNSKLVDAQWLRVSQDFGYCTNRRLKKYGKFRGGNGFVCRTYSNPQVFENQLQPAMESKDYSLDLAVARCYDTSAGVGMPGGGVADAGERRKGLPLWLLWALPVGLALAVGLGMWGIQRWGRTKFSTAKSRPVHVEGTKPLGGMSPVPPAYSPPVKRAQWREVDGAPVPPSVPESGWIVRWTGSLALGDGWYEVWGMGYRYRISRPPPLEHGDMVPLGGGVYLLPPASPPPDKRDGFRSGDSLTTGRARLGGSKLTLE